MGSLGTVAVTGASIGPGAASAGDAGPGPVATEALSHEILSDSPRRTPARAHRDDLIADPLDGKLRVRAMWLVAVVLAVGWSVASLQLRALEHEDTSVARADAERTLLDGGLGAEAESAAAQAAEIEADMSRMHLAWDPGLAALRRRLQQETQDLACTAGTDGQDLQAALTEYGASPDAPPELASLPGWDRALNLASLESTWDFCRRLR